MKLVITKALFSLLLLSSFHSNASGIIPDYYLRLSNDYNVPPKVVYALALTESSTALSNGKVAPWPYLINHDKKAILFPTKEAAALYASSLITSGKLVFDIGFFQINWYWEGQYYVEDAKELFDVRKNGEVAMTILKKRYKKTKDWSKAAGRYHNPANKNGLADIYEAKFRKNLAWIETQ